MEGLIDQLGAVLVEYGLAGVLIAGLAWALRDERKAHDKTREAYESARSVTATKQEEAFERIRQSHLDDLKTGVAIASSNAQAMSELTRTVQAVLDALAARERT